LLPVAMAGCTASAPPAPPIEQVAKVVLTVTHFPPHAGRMGDCQIKLTAQRDLAVVMDWLNSVDWSQAGIDLTAAKPPAPDGEATITAKDATVHEFGFYWDGRVIDGKGNRLVQGAQVTSCGNSSGGHANNRRC
jgi:hypothetical protein